MAILPMRHQCIVFNGKCLGAAEIFVGGGAQTSPKSPHKDKNAPHMEKKDPHKKEEKSSKKLPKIKARVEKVAKRLPPPHIATKK